MMVTVTCQTKECAHENIPFFVLGFPDRVMCGGCAEFLTPTDPTDDPVEPERTFAG